MRLDECSGSDGNSSQGELQDSSSEKLAPRAVTPQSANQCDSKSTISAKAHQS